MRHNILLYADEKTSTGSMRESLKSTFAANEFNIIPVRANDIRAGILRAPQSRVFILPGITGEISPYSAQLDRAALNEIDDFISLKRNVMLSICAGTYFISRQTIYDPAWAEPRGRQSLCPLFNGIARGPVAPYGRPSVPQSNLDDVVVVPVRFKDLDGAWQETQTCYGNGPALYPDHADDPGIEILASYAAIPNTPCAILRVSRGMGSIYMSAILPEIAYQHLEARHTYNKALGSAIALMRDLQPHEQGRKALWTTLTTRMKQDLNP